jgi:hypothetical protein
MDTFACEVPERYNVSEILFHNLAAAHMGRSSRSTRLTRSSTPAGHCATAPQPGNGSKSVSNIYSM